MSSAAVQLLPRGVYEAPYLVKGRRAMICVDRAGNVRKHLKFITDEQKLRATTALEELLEMVDPKPLALVRPDPDGPGWPYDGSPAPAFPKRPVTRASASLSLRPRRDPYSSSP